MRLWMLKVFKWAKGVWLAILGRQQFYTDKETPYCNPQYGESD